MRCNATRINATHIRHARMVAVRIADCGTLTFTPRQLANIVPPMLMRMLILQHRTAAEKLSTPYRIANDDDYEADCIFHR